MKKQINPRFPRQKKPTTENLVALSFTRWPLQVNWAGKGVPSGARVPSFALSTMLHAAIESARLRERYTDAIFSMRPYSGQSFRHILYGPPSERESPPAVQSVSRSWLSPLTNVS